MNKKIMLMYISTDSGHHKASLAIEKAFKLKGDFIETSNVNSFTYTNPILEKVIGKTYMSVIKRKPEFWEYLYDNPKIVEKTQRIRDSIHRYNTGKLKTLMDEFSPDAVICTQAFPCGMVADYKKSYNVKIGLYAVLTDYAPHSYWVFNTVDAYFVPSIETGEKLIQNGVPHNRVINAGIPIDPIFKTAKDTSVIMKKFGLDPEKPVVLLMGGSQGLGPLKEVFNSLLKTRIDMQIVVIAGRNRHLYRWFKRREKSFRKVAKKLFTYSFIDNIDELMEVSSLLISKPGGITTAEALSKGKPLLIIKPIPGQEQMNCDYLLKNNVAIKLDDPQVAGVVVEELLYNMEKLAELGMRARAFAKPDSALDIANFVLANI